VYDKKFNTQTFFRGHSDDIHCLAIHPDPTLKFVATGQLGENPRICVWNYDTKEIMMHTTEPLIKGIKNIAFSPDGRMLCASAMDEKHCIAVWDWTTSANLKPGECIKPVACG
jgi:lipoxygenase homology domain-containing protein 1